MLLSPERVVSAHADPPRRQFPSNKHENARERDLSRDVLPRPAIVAKHPLDEWFETLWEGRVTCRAPDLRCLPLQGSMHSVVQQRFDLRSARAHEPRVPARDV